MAEKVRPYVRRYGIDAVTCVPLHRRKQRQRGYNQAAVLAKVVADELGLPFCEDMLVRRKSPHRRRNWTTWRGQTT